MADTVDVCPLSELPPGAMKVFEHEDLEIAVVNCAGTLYAIEDRCSHDDGPLAEGELDQAKCTLECPRHGSLFDLTSGKPITLPAYEPIEVFPVAVGDDGVIRVEVD
ncbi:Rieske (2Fe-2S) protein [Baekduia sp. Peel2402]|uniref:Rieske (2Fe-2S) protein n=1 Tax=Baekduia sp. Peel2402 TaxID=3458296 RepID=UPI00403EA401